MHGGLIDNNFAGPGINRTLGGVGGISVVEPHLQAISFNVGIQPWDPSIPVIIRDSPVFQHSAGKNKFSIDGGVISNNTDDGLSLLCVTTICRNAKYGKNSS